MRSEVVNCLLFCCCNIAILVFNVLEWCWWVVVAVVEKVAELLFDNGSF